MPKTKHKKQTKTKDQGLKNPLALASVGLSAFSAKDQIFDFLKKYWPYLAGGTVLAIGGYYAYKAIKDPNIDLSTDNSQEPSSLSKLDAKNIAEILYKAMSSPGTDEEAIYNALNGKTYNDFVKIAEAFGKRYYDKTLGSEGGWLFNDEYGLYEWLSFELNPSDMEKLAKIIPAVFDVEKKLRVGAKAYAKKSFRSHVAENNNGVWSKGRADDFYNKGEKVGTIKLLVENPDNGQQMAVIDKPYNIINDLFIDAENLEI